MPRFKYLNSLILALVSLFVAFVFNSSPSAAKKRSSRMNLTPIPTYSQNSPQAPNSQAAPKIPGTAGCMMTRSDGTTIDLDRLCGSNVFLEKSDARNPTAVRYRELESGPGDPQ